MPDYTFSPAPVMRHFYLICRNFWLNSEHFSMRDDHQTSPFEIDRPQLRQALQRAASRFDDAAFLHREIGKLPCWNVSI